MKNFLILILAFTAPLIAEKGRPYPITQTDEELANVNYVISAMATKGYLPLFQDRKVMREKVDPLHPFAFLEYIITSDLVTYMPTIKKRGFIWKPQFIPNLTKSLKKEDKADNLKQFIDDFAKAVEIDPNRIRGYILNFQTETLVNELIAHGLSKKKNIDLFDLQ